MIHSALHRAGTSTHHQGKLETQAGVGTRWRMQEKQRAHVCSWGRALHSAGQAPDCGRGQPVKGTAQAPVHPHEEQRRGRKQTEADAVLVTMRATRNTPKAACGKASGVGAGLRHAAVQAGHAMRPGHGSHEGCWQHGGFRGLAQAPGMPQAWAPSTAGCLGGLRGLQTGLQTSRP